MKDEREHIKKNAADPTAADLPAQNPASQPHGTTQDQINEMESEGQATKEGQRSSAPLRTQDALDKNGLPKNKKAIAEDSIGARADETQG